MKARQRKGSDLYGLVTGNFKSAGADGLAADFNSQVTSFHLSYQQMCHIKNVPTVEPLLHHVLVQTYHHHTLHWANVTTNYK